MLRFNATAVHSQQRRLSQLRIPFVILGGDLHRCVTYQMLNLCTGILWASSSRHEATHCFMAGPVTRTGQLHRGGIPPKRGRRTSTCNMDRFLPDRPQSYVETSRCTHVACSKCVINDFGISEKKSLMHWARGSFPDTAKRLYSPFSESNTMNTNNKYVERYTMH